MVPAVQIDVGGWVSTVALTDLEWLRDAVGRSEVATPHDNVYVALDEKLNATEPYPSIELTDEESSVISAVLGLNAESLSEGLSVLRDDLRRYFAKNRGQTD